MSRRRMVSPEFFKHEELYDAEVASGLPLRLAFEGLWSVADRRGIFAWRARALKADVLPYDPVDFGDVLEALCAHGFIRSYVVDGKRYGIVPSFDRWQTFHPREVPNDCPAPPRNGTEPNLGNGKALPDHNLGHVEPLPSPSASITASVAVTASAPITESVAVAVPGEPEPVQPSQDDTPPEPPTTQSVGELPGAHAPEQQPPPPQAAAVEKPNEPPPDWNDRTTRVVPIDHVKLSYLLDGATEAEADALSRITDLAKLNGQQPAGIIAQMWLNATQEIACVGPIRGKKAGLEDVRFAWVEYANNGAKWAIPYWSAFVRRAADRKPEPLTVAEREAVRSEYQPPPLPALRFVLPADPELPKDPPKLPPNVTSAGSLATNLLAKLSGSQPP